MLTDESVFRSIAMINVALLLPIGLYHRINSQATGERLARREEGIGIMIGLRLCGLLTWIAFAVYLINPAGMAWSSVALPGWLRGIGVFLGAPLLFWTREIWGSVSDLHGSNGQILAACEALKLLRRDWGINLGCQVSLGF